MLEHVFHLPARAVSLFVDFLGATLFIGGFEARDHEARVLSGAHDLFVAEAVVGGTQLGPEDDIAADDVEGQVAAVMIVGVEVAAFLLAMDELTHGIQVEDEPVAVFVQAADAQDQKGVFDGFGIVAQLVFAAVFDVGVFQPVKGWGAGQGFAAIGFIAAFQAQEIDPAEGQAVIDGAQQPGTGVVAERLAGKLGHDLAWSEILKEEGPFSSVCR